jgi:hypothetical protein
MLTAEVLQDLHRDEVLEDLAGELIAARDSRLIGAQQRTPLAKEASMRPRLRGTSPCSAPASCVANS